MQQQAMKAVMMAAAALVRQFVASCSMLQPPLSLQSRCRNSSPALPFRWQQQPTLPSAELALTDCRECAAHSHCVRQNKASQQVGHVTSPESDGRNGRLWVAGKSYLPTYLGPCTRRMNATATYLLEVTHGVTLVARKKNIKNETQTLLNVTSHSRRMGHTDHAPTHVAHRPQNSSHSNFAVVATSPMNRASLAQQARYIVYVY